MNSISKLSSSSPVEILRSGLAEIMTPLETADVDFEKHAPKITQEFLNNRTAAPVPVEGDESVVSFLTEKFRDIDMQNLRPAEKKELFARLTLGALFDSDTSILKKCETPELDARKKAAFVMYVATPYTVPYISLQTGILPPELHAWIRKESWEVAKEAVDLESLNRRERAFEELSKKEKYIRAQANLNVADKLRDASVDLIDRLPEDALKSAHAIEKLARSIKAASDIEARYLGVAENGSSSSPSVVINNAPVMKPGHLHKSLSPEPIDVTPKEDEDEEP